MIDRKRMDGDARRILVGIAVLQSYSAIAARMEFLPERELWRRFAAARRERVRELIAMGNPRASATAQAHKEFAIYDRFVIDERGWMRIEGLELPATSRKRPAHRTRKISR